MLNQSIIPQTIDISFLRLLPTLSTLGLYLYDDSDVAYAALGYLSRPQALEDGGKQWPCPLLWELATNMEDEAEKGQPKVQEALSRFFKGRGKEQLAGRSVRLHYVVQMAGSVCLLRWIRKVMVTLAYPTRNRTQRDDGWDVEDDGELAHEEGSPVHTNSE